MFTHDQSALLDRALILEPLGSDELRGNILVPTIGLPDRMELLLAQSDHIQVRVLPEDSVQLFHCPITLGRTMFQERAAVVLQRDAIPCRQGLAVFLPQRLRRGGPHMPDMETVDNELRVGEEHPRDRGMVPPEIGSEALGILRVLKAPEVAAPMHEKLCRFPKVRNIGVALQADTVSIKLGGAAARGGT